MDQPLGMEGTNTEEGVQPAVSIIIVLRDLVASPFLLFGQLIGLINIHIDRLLFEWRTGICRMNLFIEIKEMDSLQWKGAEFFPSLQCIIEQPLSR